MEDETAVNREANEVVTAIDRVHGAVKALSPATPGQFDITAVPQSTHVKMRTSSLVMSLSAAGVATLNIGSRTWIFTFVASNPIVLPFVEKVDRGVDVFIVAAAGAAPVPMMAYLIYTPE